MKKLRLKRGQERRIIEGGLWVFSNQIDDPLKEYRPGEIIHLTTRGGSFLGTGYVNPHSLIAARLLSREEIEVDNTYFCKSLARASALRRKTLPNEEAVREVFSESDGLPGLIVDRYGDLIVFQITTAGMDVLRDLIIQGLKEVYQPACIYEKSDVPVRKLENLIEITGIVDGQIPEEAVWLKFSGLAMPVDVKNGQKTGLYLDQRKNIDFLKSVAKDANVLDAFCYTGAWGLAALKSGARQVTFLDSSEWALEQAMMAARRSRFAKKCRTVKGDAFTALKNFAADNEKFDVVILDPPSFIRSRSRFKEGYKGYFDLNRRALEVIETGGILITCSCSHHMGEITFLDLLKSAISHSEREGRILYRGYQGPDHPVLPSMPETRYLLCVALQIY